MLIISLKNSRYMQYTAAISATLSIACCTQYIVWTSPTLPKLRSDDSPIGVTLTDEEGSWVASIVLLGYVPGSILAGWLADKFGRKQTLLLSSIPMFVPWIVIAFANSTWTLILARFIAGMGGAAAVAICPMYIGEISAKDIRGRLGTAFNTLSVSGGLYVLCVGPFVSYKALALSCSIFPLIFASLFYFMPESPYFLIKTGQKELALQNLIKLSKKATDKKTVSSCLDEIEKTVDYDMRNKSTMWELLSNKEYRKAFIAIMGVRTLQHLSGVHAVNSYMQTIIESSKSSIPPEISSIIFGAVQLPAGITTTFKSCITDSTLISVFIAAALVDKMGRKPLLIISALGCAVALISEGIYFYLQDVMHADLTSLSWLPSTGLITLLIMASIGIFTLPYVLLGELFPTNIKGIVATIYTFYGTGLSFISIKFFVPVSEAWGMHTMFWIFAGICITGALFVGVVVPETKGKTFAEIQEKLNNNKRTERNSLT